MARIVPSARSGPLFFTAIPSAYPKIFALVTQVHFDSPMNLALSTTACFTRSLSMPAPFLRCHRIAIRCLGLLLASLGCVVLHGALPENVITDLRSRAASGNPIAQYNLGIAYADPNDPISDLSEAYAWLTLAAERGSNQGALNTLLPKLSSSQLAEGKRRLEEKRAQLARAAEQSPFITPASSSVSAAPSQDADIASLRAEQRRLSAEIAAARREADAAKSASIAKVAELNQQLAERDRLIAALRAQASPAPATSAGESSNVASLEAALKRSDAARENLARDLAALSSEATALKEQLASEQRARAQLASDALATKDRAADLATAKNQTASLRSELDKARSAASQALAQVAALAAAKEKAELHQRTSSADKDLELAKTRTDLDSARLQLAQRDESIARLKEETRRLADEVASAKLAAAASNEISQLRSDLQAARTALTAVEKERDDLRLAPAPPPAADADEVANLRKQLTDTESKLTTALRSYTLQQGEIEAARKTIASLTEDRDQVASQLAQATQEKSALSQEITAATPVLAEINTLRDQLRYAQSQTGAMALEVNQLKTRLALAAPSVAGAYGSPTRPGSVAAAAVVATPPEKAVPTTTASPAMKPASAPPRDNSAAAASNAAGAPRVHVVKLGDSLSKIAMQYYGQSNRWEEIAAANRDVLPNPNQLVVGTPLRIP